MNFKKIQSWRGSLWGSSSTRFIDSADQADASRFGKASFSRRHFMEAAAGATGIVLGADLGMPNWARAAVRVPSTLEADDGPQHLPGGFPNPALPAGCPSEIVHFFGPGPTNENSSIWDFDGSIGVAVGTVNGTGNLGGQAQSFSGVAVDMRFMKGKYVGLDGNVHKGAFVFV